MEYEYEYEYRADAIEEARAEAKMAALEALATIVAIIIVIAIVSAIMSSVKGCQNAQKERNVEGITQFVVSQTACEKDCQVEILPDVYSTRPTGFCLDIKKSQDRDAIYQQIREAFDRGKYESVKQIRLTYVDTNGETVVVNDANGDFLPDVDVATFD